MKSERSANRGNPLGNPEKRVKRSRRGQKTPGIPQSEVSPDVQVNALSSAPVFDQPVTIEDFVASLGVDSGIERLEITVAMTDIIGSHLAIQNPGLDTKIPPELAKSLRSHLTQATRTDEDTDIPPDVMADIEEAFAKDKEPKDHTVFQKAEQKSTEQPEAKPADAEPAEGEGHYKAVDLLFSVIEGRASLKDRLKLRRIVEEYKFDPDRLTETQYKLLRTRLIREFSREEL